jgi:signal recognition particle subunit SRP54
MRAVKTGSFDLEDFLEQLQRLKRMGPFVRLLGLLPGLKDFERRFRLTEIDDGYLKVAEAIVFSMTPDERRDPQIVRASRLWRIARGSGASPRDVQELLERFEDVRPPLGPSGPQYA